MFLDLLVLALNTMKIFLYNFYWFYVCTYDWHDLLLVAYEYVLVVKVHLDSSSTIVKAQNHNNINYKGMLFFP